MNNKNKTNLEKSLNSLTNKEYIDNSKSRTLKHFAKVEESKKELTTKDVLEIKSYDKKSLNKNKKKNKK
jgi:hypothetical protein|tara:strand:+ start:1002 stop:1208 length:207 start_codon:yes stop_codon:yes gene_type:complete